MITKPQFQRLIIMRLNCMIIDDERELPEEIGGYAARLPCNLLEWVLPTERFGFGGTGSTWEVARSELIDAIWNRLNSLPVTKKKMRTCEFCKRKFTSPYKNTVRFCNKNCSDGHWHGVSVKRRKASTLATQLNHR
jgi:hypothetical protein